MRRVVTALVPMVASLSLLGCGSDASSSDVGAVAETGVEPLLIDSLPEISGPTVLWFWAPG